MIDFTDRQTTGFSHLAAKVAACLLLLLSVVRAAPTAEQQYVLELVNRLRMSPAAELEKLVNMSSPGVWGSPMSDDPLVAAALSFYQVSASALAAQWGSLVAAPPVAWNDSLAAAGSLYSDLMINLDQQAHGLGGVSLSQRLVNAGYSANWGDVAQMLFATAGGLNHAHAALAVDWGPDGGNGTGIQPGASHRTALMDPLFKELGIGFQTIAIPLSNTSVTGDLVITEHMANTIRSNGIGLVSDAILTGSVINDSVMADSFYTPGEGLADVLVFVYDNSNGALVASGQTNSAGGFNISLAGLSEGATYRVEAPETGQAARLFSLNGWQENYGTPSSPVWVTFYDNVHASFIAVPEPAPLGLALAALLCCPRNRSC